MVYNHTTYSLSENDLRMVKSVPPGGNWKNIPHDIPSKRLEQIRVSGGRTTLYGRLSFDKPSYTITTYFNRPGNGTYIHPIHNRVISAREAARFQSFPDNYIFEGSKGSLCKQIGNAVPPLLAFSIANQIQKKTKTKNLLDLFCGAGGLSLGFGWAGYKIIVANDNFKQACETYRANHTDTVLIEGDIADKQIQDTVLKESERGKVDIVVGGPPCQGFSHAGKRMIDDPRNFLYKEFVNIVKKIKPKVFVMENVEGILTINGGKTYEEVKNNFQRLGYSVAGKKLHAVQFGVPQKRKRVVIIGVLNGDPEELFPNPIINNEENYITTENAIGDLFNVEVGGPDIKIKLTTKPAHPFQKFARGLISPGEYIKIF
ncbi:MAG: DNA (cytosine-5-)-methyltransferase [Parcubacteria group bacterium CG11_big_fil_rev_8_21_14_0_20_39_22]|nr:MAG: DNA (cytosine-5-)-methyltransferase [Parcubacteria group bacterium CG11_big_fil_rev_8_21_14_0_20_39_22]